MGIQIVELHFSQAPRCDYWAVKKRAESILGEELDASDAKGANAVYLLTHKQHMVRYDEGEAPAQTAILAANATIDLKKYTDDIQQSWGFPDCEGVLSQSRHTLMVTEMMARRLAPGDRIGLFHAVLQAAIEVTQPDALVFKHSQQVVQPDSYLAHTQRDPIFRPGALNVRFFTIANSTGDMLMDTRGLTEIGLHDLQCHFRELDPNDVSRVLFNTAIYIFENGPVIESGNTILGINSESKWVCQFEDALVEPARDILDINPGAPFAAGNRQ